MGKPKGNRKKDNQANFTEFDDEIDSFEKQKDKISLDNENEGSEAEKEVNPVYDLEISDEEDEGDVNDDSEEDGEADENDDDENDLKWGKKKKVFYSDDEVDDEDEEGQEEVKRLQQKRAKSLSTEDFEIEASLGERAKSESDAQKSKTKPTKKSDAGMLEQINKELDSITLDIDGDAEFNIHKDISNLSEKEKLELIAQDSPELLELLEEFKNKISDVKENIQPLLEKIKSKELPTTKGVSFLEVKQQLLLSYCIHICFYLLLKSEGKSVKDHPVIEQLVRIRTIMERLKPLDQKLKYQVEKLLKIAAIGGNAIAEDDPRRFRPNPDALVEDSKDDEDEDNSNKIYKAPRLVEMHYDDKTQDAKKKKEDKIKKRAARSAIMRDIMAEYSEKPEDAPADGGVGSIAREEEDLERIRYEEDNMIRLMLTKKEKKKQKKNQLKNEFDELVDYGDIASLNEDKENDNEPDPSQLLRRKSMKQVINNLKSGKNSLSGDLDLPLRDPDSKKRKMDDMNEGEDDFIGLADDDGEDDFYKQAKLSANQKKQKGVGRLPQYADDRIEDGQKRSISNQIEKNRGLMKQRPKETKNPRKKFRSKYETKLKKQRGMVTKMADTSRPYQGETTGIKTNIVRSRKFK